MSGLKTPLPERKRSYKVALTPLADAMFQLLIFFMLTTSLTPYSLITIRSAETEVSDTDPGVGDGPANQQAAPSGQFTIWQIEDGLISSRGLDYTPDQLPALAEAIRSVDGQGTVVIIVGDTARVQDVAEAMAALKSADISGVQITREGL